MSFFNPLLVSSTEAQNRAMDAIFTALRASVQKEPHSLIRAHLYAVDRICRESPFPLMRERFQIFLDSIAPV